MEDWGIFGSIIMEYQRTSDKLLADHMISEENRLTTIENRLQQLEEKIDTLETSIQSLVDAWRAAGTLVSFIKWVGGGIVAIGAILTFIKGYN